MSASKDHYDVLSLLMPMFSGNKDDYGKDVVPPLPLFFDRVNEGRPPRSNASLFRLPFEILAAITQHLSESSLASLSLVSKDCCQLARSCRFRSVQLNYSAPQSHLIVKLLDEAQERLENNGYALSPSIGACIRRLQIATDARWVSHRHNLDLAELNEMDIEEKEKRIRDAHSMFFGRYIPAIELILVHALPHLELLDFEDKVPIPKSFFNALTCSSIQHLKLYRVNISEEFEIQMPQALVHRGWPLRTLHLELIWRIRGGTRGRTAPLCASILRLCAPTLESLIWDSVLSRDEEDVQSLAGQELPCFGRLRELKLKGVRFSDPSNLNLLMFPQPQSRLQVLEMDADRDPLEAQFLESCGAIPSLETFIWNAFQLADDHPLLFLRCNPQLSKLSLPDALSPTLLDAKILPMLSQSFKRLRSLSLAWKSVSISNSALEIIGTLHTLEQLHLSAGYQFGWRHDWLIKHEEMRKYLRPLHNLRKIAFSRDSYKGRWDSGQNYYSIRIPLPDVAPENPEELEELRELEDLQDLQDLEGVAAVEADQISEISEKIWERQHRRRILKEADKYLRMLPRLEWMYFGQIPMSVVDSADSHGRKAAVLSQERDSCWTLLRRMFGRETSDG